MLLDPNELAGTRAFVGIGNFAVSDDSNLLAYTIDFTGFRQYALHIKDLRTGETLPGHRRTRSPPSRGRPITARCFTPPRTRPPSVPTSSGGTRWATLRSRRLYHEKDELYDIGVDKTRDRQMIVLGIESKDTSECRYLRADRPQDQFAVFLPREKAHRYYIDHRESEFFIRTNRGGRNFEVKTAPEIDPGAGTLEDVRGARRQRADPGNRPISRLRRGDRTDRGDRPAASLQFRNRGLAADCVSRAGVRRVARRHAGLRFLYLSIQLSELHHASERLRLRRAIRSDPRCSSSRKFWEDTTRRSTRRNASGPRRATA